MRAERFGSYSIADHFRGHAAFPAFEIDLAIFLFVTAADVTRSQTAVVIAAAASSSSARSDSSAGFALRDFLESRKRLEAQRRSEWAKILKCHNN